MLFNEEEFLKRVENLAWAAESKTAPFDAYYLMLIRDEEVSSFLREKGINPDIIENSLDRSVKESFGIKGDGGQIMLAMGPGGVVMPMQITSVDSVDDPDESENKFDHAPEISYALQSANENMLIAGRKELSALDVFPELLSFSEESDPRIFNKLGVDAELFYEAGYGFDFFSVMKNSDRSISHRSVNEVVSLLENPDVRSALVSMFKDAVAGLQADARQASDLEAGSSGPALSTNDHDG